MLQKPGSLRSSETLHVIVPIMNPVRYHSRYRLFEQFRERVRESPNVRLWIVEVAFGDRKHEVTEAGNPQHLQLRTSHELWLKESSLNLMIQRLPEDAQYLAWVDGDVQFLNPYWARETIHQLQHHQIVQMWRSALDLGPTGNVIQVHTSFGYLRSIGAAHSLVSRARGSYGDMVNVSVAGQGPYSHPGFAWAARKEAIDKMGGLLDVGIVGAGDHHMSCAWVGEAARSIPPGLSPAYGKRVMDFQDRCERYIRRDVGYVEGTIAHFFHGRKRDRQYWDRWSILRDNAFDPDRDIKRDHQGLWQLDPAAIGLRDALRSYFRQRNEDGTEE